MTPYSRMACDGRVTVADRISPTMLWVRSVFGPSGRRRFHPELGKRHTDANSQTYPNRTSDTCHCAKHHSDRRKRLPVPLEPTFVAVGSSAVLVGDIAQQ